MDNNIGLSRVYFDWLSNVEFVNPAGITPTFKKMFEGHWVSQGDVERAFRFFLRLLNQRLFGRSARRYGASVRVIPTIERMADGRFHCHAMVDRPQGMEFEEFEQLIRDCWSLVDLGYREIDVRDGVDEGWLRYLCKGRTKPIADQIIDLGNLRI